MTNAETQKVLQFIKDLYGKDYTQDTIRLWSHLLQDISYTEASHALTSWFQTERWPPTIADIRAKVFSLTNEPETLASSAWDQLIRALRMSHAPNAESIWNELPDATKMIVGGFATFRAWGNTETASLESVQRPMFMKRFEDLQRRVRKESAATPSLREPLPSLPEPPKAPAIEDKQEERVRASAPADKMAELRRRLSKAGTGKKQ